MADNFLEYHREDYEKKKAEWLSHLPKVARTIERPEDESL